MDQTEAELNAGPQERYVCRVCLAADVDMFSLHTKGLNQDFFDISGLQLSPGDGLPCHICYICCALLKKATMFRHKCHSSHELMLNHMFTVDFIKHINLLHEKQLTITNIQTISLTGNDCLNTSQLVDVKTEYCGDINDNDQNDGGSTTDESPRTCDELMVTENLNNSTDSNNSKAKLNVTKNKQSNVKEEKIKTEKYNLTGFLFSSSEKEGDQTSSDDDFKPLSLYPTVNTADDNKKETFTKTREIYKKVDCYAKRKNELKGKKVKETVKRKRKKKEEIRKRDTVDKFDKTYNCKVKVLSKPEQVDVVKARAESNKYKYGKYKCEDCYTGFVVESKFISHRQTHDPVISGNIECEICHVRFKDRLHYMKHALRHKYKYICKECGAVSYSRSFAKGHYEFHAGIKYECQYCNQVFSKYATRVNHVRNKHGSVECAICHELFGPGGLGLHLALAHKQTYKCSSCERVFNDPEALKRHMKGTDDEVCDPNLRSCTRCGECFKMDEDDLYNEHIEEHREMNRKKITKTGKMGRKRTAKHDVPTDKNEDADGTSGTNNAIESDEDVTTVCYNQFGAKTKRRGAEKTSLMCEICALNTFKSITALRYHQRIHSGEKPHQCPSCPKRFRLTHTLQWHIRTHTGDRPYACSQCTKTFKTNTALCRHRLVHTNERRHVCNLCGKAFQTSTNVKLHIRTVHMKIPMPPRVRNRKKRVEEMGETC